MQENLKILSNSIKKKKKIEEEEAIFGASWSLISGCMQRKEGKYANQACKSYLSSSPSMLEQEMKSLMVFKHVSMIMKV